RSRVAGVLRRGVAEHALLGELRKVLLDGIVDAQQAFLLEQQNAQRRDRPVHRVDPEESVRRHRVTPLQITETDSLELGQTPVPYDARHRTRDVARIYVAL